ncbi:unnamed protein product [Menidia menidia]|uniref:(Atlantic silverside) hypothetical protein n=1 Tax=Menidia menidia TaxID=238744 RepID=A0A8S4B7S0_9TELE|nr:unnamed protein product [Menidia menidia]
MMEWTRAWPLALLAVASLCLGPAGGRSPVFCSKTLINNVVADPRTGRLYAGAVNALYQLSPDLRVESQTETGPRRDNRQCTPPVTDSCEEAESTDNHNKLLLVHAANGSLVACGSIFRGICSLRNLSDVDHLLYFRDTNGEKSYVASAEEGVSVVGVMSYYSTGKENLPVFLVRRKTHTLTHSRTLSNTYQTALPDFLCHDSTKLISTRILEETGDWVAFDSIIEASAVQANPFVLRYLHDFRFAFKHGGFVYFLFSRTLGMQDTKNFTFIARMCEDDKSYYSYTELQLNCSANNKFNKAQSVTRCCLSPSLLMKTRPLRPCVRIIGSPGNVHPAAEQSGAKSLSFYRMYPLDFINDKIMGIIEACYSNNGIIKNKPAVYSPYSSKSEDLCSSNNQNYMALKYKCGAEFLPSPLASKAEFALTSEPLVVRKGHMTAVAVAVEMGHTVAFLGTATGELLKVHLSARPEVYSRVPGEGPGDRVNKNLLLDSSLQHLYVTTEKKITKVPVQACHLKTDCSSCMSMKDPYCGWCVLEGKCTRKQDCGRSAERNTWLWSPDQKCVEIEAFSPMNISCKKTQQVDISIPSLPRLQEQDKLLCVFGHFSTDAVMHARGPLLVLVNRTIEVTSGEYSFYNCAATVRKNGNTPCIACVTSQWGCQWNARDHICSDRDDSVEGGHIVKPQQSENCPQFESPEPILIPVGFEIPIGFQGRNLGIYEGRRFSIGTELMKHTEEEVIQELDSTFKFKGYQFAYDKLQEVNVSFHVKDRDTGKKIDSTLTVVLYNCSVGREDCSLCKHAHAKYQCVWCTASRACVYSRICTTPPPAHCPDPEISDLSILFFFHLLQIIPRYGPLNGQISVTIRGSNMGIKKEDIKKITVAGVNCDHLEDRYSKAPPYDLPVEPSLSGAVEIEVDGGRRGVSRVKFTYRDPEPKSVHPSKGPAAGGTEITIVGDDLETATKEDIAVTIGSVPCEVLAFGRTITCKTGRYRGQKVPSEPLTVTVKYGKNTEKHVPMAFQYCDNPKILDYKPKASFICGGRRIEVTGTGFDLIQSAVMKVLPSADDFSQNTTPAKFEEEALKKNDTVLVFHSPSVANCSDSQSLRTVLQLDNLVEELTGFKYHPDPVFDELAKNVITERSIIVVTGEGFSKAMTLTEAQAFVGDASCHVNILQDDKLFLEAPSSQPKARSKRQRRDTTNDMLDLLVKFGRGEWIVGTVYYARKDDIPLAIIVPAVIVPMLLFIAVSVYCYRRKSQQAEREYEKVKNQLANLEESVRDRCKKEFTDLMIEMEDHTSDLSEGRIPFLDYKTYTDRNFFLPSKEGSNDPMITGKIQIPEVRRATVAQALNQFSNLLNSKTFLINFIHTLESRPDFNARARGYFASLLTVALHGKLEYYTDIMRTLLLELMDEHVQNKNPKLMLRRSETVVERMLCNWMSICLYQFLRDTAGEPLYKLYKALKHQVEKGPVDGKLKKAKYTLNDTGLLGDDVEYSVLVSARSGPPGPSVLPERALGSNQYGYLAFVRGRGHSQTLQVLVHGEGPDVTPVKVLNCDSITQVKEKIIEQVYRNLPYSQRPKVESVALEWRPGSTGQILSDLDLTSQKEGRWKRLNTLAHYNVRDNATLVLSRVLHTQSFHQHQDSHDETRPDCPHMSTQSDGPLLSGAENALLEDDNTYHLGTLQQFVDDFFRSVLCSSSIVPPAVKYFFDFLDEQAHRHENVDEETLHIWKTNSLPMRYWVNILRNPHFIFDVHVTEVVDASLHVIAQTFMDACTKTEHKLSRESPSNKLLYAKEISTYKKMVDDYYKGIRQMIPVSDQDMNTHLAEVSRFSLFKILIGDILATFRPFRPLFLGVDVTKAVSFSLQQHTDKLNTQIIQSLDDDPAAQNKQLTLRLQQVAAALENKVTDL